MIWEGSKPTSDDEPITSEKADQKGPLSELLWLVLLQLYCNVKGIFLIAIAASTRTIKLQGDSPFPLALRWPVRYSLVTPKEAGKSSYSMHHEPDAN